MSYLGRRVSDAPLTSADIPDDVVQGTDIAYLENDSTTQNLGGTYSTERMYLNDSYTLNDNVTVTNHLALGTIADSDVVITNDSSARTITGSGTIEAGRLMNDFQSSLTGMTGELGIGVTNNAGVTSGTIGSGVTGGAGLDGAKTASSAFLATPPDSGWNSANAANTVINFNTVSGNSCFSVGGDYDTANSRYIVPATGLYFFSYNIYTALNDASNGFKICVNGAELLGAGGGRLWSFNEQGSGDHVQSFDTILSLTQGQYVDVRVGTLSDWYSGHAMWSGMRIT